MIWVRHGWSQCSERATSCPVPSTETPTRASATCSAWTASGMLSALTVSSITEIIASFRHVKTSPFLGRSKSPLFFPDCLRKILSFSSNGIVSSLFRGVVVVADKTILVPQRGEGERDSEVHRYIVRSDIHNQQREDCVPQWEATAEAWKGGHQHLWDLLQKPPWFLQVLFSGLQGKFFWFSSFFLAIEVHFLEGWMIWWFMDKFCSFIRWWIWVFSFDFVSVWLMNDRCISAKSVVYWIHRLGFLVFFNLIACKFVFWLIFCLWGNVSPPTLLIESIEFACF